MALRNFFLQNLNSMFPERLPGTAKGWDTSSSNREVCLDPDLSPLTEVYPSMAVKLTGRQGQTLYVAPCTDATDTPFGFVIYKAKNAVNRISRNQMATVGRMMQIMDFVMSDPVTAGDAIYQDPTTYMCSTDSASGVYVGTALETVPATAEFPVVAAVEINIHGHGTKGESNVTSVNGLDGDVTLTGANIKATLTNGEVSDTQSITMHLQTLKNEQGVLGNEMTQAKSDIDFLQKNTVSKTTFNNSFVTAPSDANKGLTQADAYTKTQADTLLGAKLSSADAASTYATLVALGEVNTNVTNVTTAVGSIEDKIPATASATNQLADKDFVNSSINNMAAFYITSDETGNAFATKAALVSGPWYFDGKTRQPTTNDYAVVLADETHDGKTYRYSYTGTQWSAQYPFNNTTMTQAQVNAINSGITAGKVSSYDSHLINESNPHKVTKEQVGLGNCDNTSDLDKPISTATQAALDLKVGKSDFASTLTQINKGATLVDIQGLRGDYCSRYGVTASPNGRPYISGGNMVVPAGLVLTIPGASGEPVAPQVTIASQVTVPVTITDNGFFAYVAGLDQPFQFCDKVCFSLIQPADDESTCQLWFDGKGWHFRSLTEGNVWVNVRAHILDECIFTGSNLTRLNPNGWYHDMYSKLGDIESLLATI